MRFELGDFEPTTDNSDVGGQSIGSIDDYPSVKAVSKKIAAIFSSIGERRLGEIELMDPEARVRAYTEAGLTNDLMLVARDAFAEVPDLDGDDDDLFWHGRVRTVEELEESIASWEKTFENESDALEHPYYLSEKARLEELRARQATPESETH